MTAAEQKGPDWWANRASVILRTTLGEERFPIDVEQLALEWTPMLDPAAPITKVAARELEGCDGALVDARHRGKGWGIAYAKGMTEGRRRFTIGHELGHYLLHRHRAPEGGFNCRQEDMATWDHERSPQESEANRFAARLLMPLDDLRRQIPPREAVSLEKFGRLADERYGVSLTACVLQWLEITERRAILVVSREGYVLWAKSSKPALRSGAFFRTRSASPLSVPPASPAAGGWLDPGSESIPHSAGVWLDEPVVEEVILSDLYDLGISLLHLGDHGGHDLDEPDELPDALDLMNTRSGVLS
ncbi:ImmA/IrrE family metallo-endopeptidase [Paracoccus sp. Z118]|uniref:ImmA/IrrE family metallo-endopeptidase n=1 Tax=Paracoccus sp. Z118 TaxID=2851017 RepID=UPI001C2CB03E|nr:ImmA/IrrE family metallo-endopeptidase [Paracoccus sp. Z118]MBV0893141.1 ImmA/IrrE family metallo-endopeptidase [Paracoccus sp. Z118]